MTINVKKTKLMPFDTHNRITHLSELDFRLDGNILGSVQTYKYLGIILDSTLTYKQHLSHIEKTVSHKTFLLRKLRHYLTSYASLVLYKSMTLPYLEYGSLIYASGSKLQLQRLQTLQNMNIRMCFDLPNRMRTSELHTIANLNLLEDRRNTQLLNLMYTR